MTAIVLHARREACTKDDGREDSQGDVDEEGHQPESIPRGARCVRFPPTGNVVVLARAPGLQGSVTLRSSPRSTARASQTLARNRKPKPQRHRGHGERQFSKRSSRSQRFEDFFEKPFLRALSVSVVIVPPTSQPPESSRPEKNLLVSSTESTESSWSGCLHDLSDSVVERHPVWATTGSARRSPSAPRPWPAPAGSAPASGHR